MTVQCQDPSGKQIGRKQSERWKAARRQIVGTETPLEAREKTPAHFPSRTHALYADEYTKIGKSMSLLWRSISWKQIWPICLYFGLWFFNPRVSDSAAETLRWTVREPRQHLDSFWTVVNTALMEKTNNNGLQIHPLWSAPRGHDCTAGQMAGHHSGVFTYMHWFDFALDF